MEAFVRDFLQNLQVEDVKTKLSWKTSDFQNCSLQGTVLCSHCFIAVIVFLQSSFLAVIPCGHSSFPSLFFTVIVLCHHCSLQGTVLCSHCFIAVIGFLQSSFFAVIPLCSHCSLQSLCFAIIVLCSHGSLRSWSLAVLEKDASARPAERLFKVGNI